MKVHIIGARALNPIQSSKVKKHASARIVSDKKIVQIDVGNPWRGNADALLITHLHQDHIGKINTVPKNTTVFVPHSSFYEYLKKRTKAPIKIFNASKILKLGPFQIKAFKAEHSKYTKTYGFRISQAQCSIAWLPDFRNLKGCTKYLKNLNALFIGASCLKRNIVHRNHDHYGHMAIIRSLSALQKQQIHPKKIYLMHLGKQLTPLKQKQVLLQDMFPCFNISVVVDGQRILI